MKKHIGFLRALVLFLLLPAGLLTGVRALLRYAAPLETPQPVLPENAVPLHTAPEFVPGTMPPEKPVTVRLGDVFETTSDVTALDLSGIDLSELPVSQFLFALPHLERVTMHGCGLDNDGYAALQDLHPSVKLVWDITMQDCYTLSTDAVAFSTLLANEKQPRLTNDDAKYFRYCDEMVALDIGHNHISDISFLEYMPHLRVLILADNCTKEGDVILSDISPLRFVPHLRYLELFANGISDMSVLSELTELEDLNICYNPITTTEPFRHLPHLQRLWAYANYVPWEELEQLTELYPDAEVVLSGEGSVDQGWRDSPHYAALRNMVFNNIIDDEYQFDPDE